jgi:hypothetical protein
MLGTPHYMSLEQLQAAEIDARSDVYAFGVVLYEALTGQRPYESDNFSAIVVKVATETPVDPLALRPELPPALRDVVLRAMARQRDERYPSMHALIDALKPFADSTSWPEPAAPAPRPGPPVAAEPTRTSGGERDDDPARPTARARWALGAFVLLAASAGASWLGFSKTSSLPTAPVTAAPATPASAGPTERPAAADTNGTLASPGEVAPTGADTQPPQRAGVAGTFTSGWVYLGQYQDERWVTRYFEGFGDRLPSVGAKITPHGRSYVRFAVPDTAGALAGARTTIGPETRVEILELAHWQGGSFVWARVRPVP